VSEELDFNSAGELARYLADSAGDEAADMTDDDPSAPLPRTIGEYRVRRLIAVGGMAEVFEAVGPSQKRVALKVVRHYPPGSPAARRLLREADLLQLLDHPCVARVHEAGEAPIDGNAPGLPYIAMDLIEQGRPIDAYVEEAGLSTRERVRLMSRVVDAVSHAHRRGVIHRDLKPSNVLVGADGEPVVVDFGIGANAGGVDATMQTLQTLPGQLLGTLQYMSPEQVSGEPAGVDLRTDVYSLGMILYKVVTGETPYTTAGVPLVIATQIVRTASVPQMRTNGRRVDRDLEAVIAKCLSKSASQRYQTVEALCDDLNRWLRGHRVEARSSRWWIGFTQWLGRHPIAATLLACSTIVLVSVATAVVSVRIVNSTPHSLYVNRSSRLAQVRTLSGRVMHEWQDLAAMGGNNKTAVIVRASDGRQSERFIAVCMSTYHEHDTSNLEIVSMQDPEHVLWSGPGVTPTDRYPEYLERDLIKGTALPDKRKEFFGRKLAVADVFEEVPGEELIVLAPNRRHFPTAIRIYSLSPMLTGDDPEVLYECWHPGHLDSVHWHEESDSLLVTGKNNRLDYAQVNEAHHNWRHPGVLFAVRPVQGHIESQLDRPRWLTEFPSGSERGPLWYRVLTPTEQCGLWEFSGILEGRFVAESGRTLVARMKYTGEESPDASTFVYWDFNPHTGDTVLGPINDTTRAKDWLKLPGSVLEDGSMLEWAMTPVEGPCYWEVDPLPMDTDLGIE
jgi:serine/threonine protein kinase